MLRTRRPTGGESRRPSFGHAAPPHAPPPALAAGFIALALAMAVLFVGASWAAPLGETGAVRRAWALRALAVAVVYLGVSAALAWAGVLARLDARPPPAALMLAAFGAGMAALAFSRFGERLLAWPLGVLVGY